MCQTVRLGVSVEDCVWVTYCSYTGCGEPISAGVWNRKPHHSVRNWVAGYWRGYLSGSRCRLAYGPADATATHCLLLHTLRLVCCWVPYRQDIDRQRPPCARSSRRACSSKCRQCRVVSWRRKLNTDLFTHVGEGVDFSHSDCGQSFVEDGV